ncbi:MAG: radical SAM protein, partial [Candidatus Micrarchaeota archaeon]
HANKLLLPHSFAEGADAVPVEICEGCAGRCAYCGTKNARGDLFSYPVQDIVKHVNELAKKGHIKILLTAQDTGCYGLDIGSTLPELLKKISAIDGNFACRIGMMNPCYAAKYADEIIALMNEPNSKFLPFIHIPIQSGSDKVLKEMKRIGTAAEFKKTAEKFRKAVSGITIATDIIVGFPTETDADFKKTVKLLKDAKPDVVNISMFYPRPNTAAAEMKQLASQTVKKRSCELTKLCKALKNNK